MRALSSERAARALDRAAAAEAPLPAAPARTAPAWTVAVRDAPLPMYRAAMPAAGPHLDNAPSAALLAAAAAVPTPVPAAMPATPVAPGPGPLAHVLFVNHEVE